MDVDMLKSSSLSSSSDAYHHHHHHHHNMDMTAMMMQMPMQKQKQKQPFPENYFRDPPSSTFSDIDFGWAPNLNPNNPNVSETLFHNYPNNASLMNANPNNLPSSVSFMGSPIQAQEPNPSPRVLMTSSRNRTTSMAAMREMIFRIAAMQPIQIDPESVKAPKRRNVKISKDPQSVAARHRRERISEKMRILQRLVPGGTKMDTASMLDEAIHYVKFLKKQVQSLERTGGSEDNRPVGVGFQGNFPGLVRPGSNYSHHHSSVGWVDADASIITVFREE